MMAQVADLAVMISQSFELSLAGKATAMIAAGLVVARLAAHARAAARHVLLAATFASLVALPLILLAAPHATIDVPVAGNSARAARAAAPRVEGFAGV